MHRDVPEVPQEGMPVTLELTNQLITLTHDFIRSNGLQRLLALTVTAFDAVPGTSGSIGHRNSMLC